MSPPVSPLCLSKSSWQCTHKRNSPNSHRLAGKMELQLKIAVATTMSRVAMQKDIWTLGLGPTSQPWVSPLLAMRCAWTWVLDCYSLRMGFLIPVLIPLWPWPSLSLDPWFSKHGPQTNNICIPRELGRSTEVDAPLPHLKLWHLNLPMNQIPGYSCAQYGLRSTPTLCSRNLQVLVWCSVPLTTGAQLSECWGHISDFLALWTKIIHLSSL